MRTKSVFARIEQKQRLFMRMLAHETSERNKRRILRVLFPEGRNGA